jgi:hypothetical protein
MKGTALALAVLLAAAGCSTSAPSSQATVATLVPSSSPSASPSPSRPASAAVLAARLKAAGLPVRHLIVYTAASDPNHLLGRQGGYASKVAWQDPRAARQDAGDSRGSIGLGGGIEAFPTAAGARARYQYLRGFQPPFGDGYDYLDGTAILRLSQYLTPAQAHAYRAAFTAAVQQP